MLHLAAAGLLINLQRRGLFEVIPDNVRSRWKKWQPRGLVISSLVLQIALILSGKRRKYKGVIWFRFFVWSTYLLADWVATLALGVIANNLEGGHGSSPPDKEEILMWFWAPFLLVHLGGPDTITAYSMEDNELWQRRSLELITQAVASLYIFLIVWPEITPITALTIPMLVVGVVKFGERIGSLRSASAEHFRDSLLTPPDPGPNYAKFMEDFTLKKAEGFYVKADVIIEASVPANALPDAPDDESKLIVKAYSQFQRFKRLFVDLILSFQDRDESQSFFSTLEPENAFHVIEVELGFIYDVLYTKAPVVYSKIGCFLRFITMILTLLVLALFPFISRGKNYGTVDLAITYLLMGGAIVLEMCGLLFLLSSDWTQYWLSNHGSQKFSGLLKCISWSKPKKRWSTSMAQYSLLNECLKEEPGQFKKLLTLNKAVETHLIVDDEDVSLDLKTLIFQHCLDISKEIKNSEHLMKLCRSRGDYALEKSKLIELNWSTTKVEFDQSILLWHIATELCYYSDKDVSNRSKESTESKHISDYMLYLLAMCPFMLPVGIGLIRFRDTCAEAKEFFKNKGHKTSDPKPMACRMLLRVNTEVLPSQVKGDRSKSVLFDACRLATSLRAMDRDLENPMERHAERKWKIISQVWVEILGYAAIHCRGTQHAQQLRKGGELLTHVWLLMAHLGITEQLQISQGHARAKLNVK